MITRDPLEIPCLKKEYWETFAEVPGSDLAKTLQMVRQQKNKYVLPRVSQLSPEERLAAEEKNIWRAWSIVKMTWDLNNMYWKNIPLSTKRSKGVNIR
jgi:hypothetical protein